MPKFKLLITVRIETVPYSGQNLQIQEDVDISANSFMEMCEVLSQFHKLSETFEKSKRG